jgi:hypothetical protein
MTTIGITGHMNLTPASVPLVREAIRAVLTPYSESVLVGISCLAAGADSIFAELVLDLGGELQAILPAADYRDRKVAPEHAAQFDDLIRRADSVQVMPFAVSNSDAYAVANEAVLAACDRLIAVWDGQAPADKGGTAAVVHQATKRGLPVEVVWPEGAERG